MIRTLLRKWRESRTASQQLDSLLAQVHPGAPLAERNQWLVELLYWLRRPIVPSLQLPPHAMAGVTGKAPNFPEHVRLRFMLQVIERNTEVKRRLARTLRSLIKENDPRTLFCDTGMAAHPGFGAELLDRIQTRLIPPAPNEPHLSTLFAMLFVDEKDADWIGNLDGELLHKLAALLQFEVSSEEAGWNIYVRDMGYSLQILVSLVQAAGVGREIRVRLAGREDLGNAFLSLSKAIDAVVTLSENQGAAEFQQALNHFRALLDHCREAARHVYAHLDENGVSVAIVFELERMLIHIGRIERLLEVWLDRLSLQGYARLTADLIRASQGRRSVSRLVREAFSLLARKIVESSAETGEHYIAGNRKEYVGMLKKAAGGGALTACTVYIKFMLTSLHLPKFLEGVLVSMNYAGSFLAIHFAHFTLATKQPAMTAPALADRLDLAHTHKGIQGFVEATVALIRSQAAAIFGNLALVIPVALSVQLICHYSLGWDTLTPAKAMQVIDSLSLWGMTPLYAAFTGVLLWLSSLAAGWVDNWFALHRLHDVLMYHRRLRYVLGASGATRFADFWRRNVSGIAANVSLGFLLGLLPEVLSFVGLPVEVRHVTLGAGSVAVAAGVLGWDVLSNSAFWLAVAGIASVGLLNVGVSFGLAFQMALRSRILRTPDQRALLRAVWKQILRHPFSLIFPPRQS